MFLGAASGLASAGSTYLLVDVVLGGIKVPIAFFPAFYIPANAVWWGFVGGGLMAAIKEGKKPAREDKGGKLQRFAVAGADGKWSWAEARIDGDTVVVSSPKVSGPIAVRYAWSQNPAGANLYNREGLPACPFAAEVPTTKPKD